MSGIRRTWCAESSDIVDREYLGAADGIRNFSFDLVTLTSFSTGANTLVHQPGGGGTISLGTGRLQFDDTTGQVVGYHGPTDDGEYDDLCAALS